MPHIHEKIDFVVGFWIIYENKVLLVDHKLIGQWVCPGGHVELDEDPEQTLFREMQEETGLTEQDVEVLSTKPNLQLPGRKFLYTPNYLDIHDMNAEHRHIGITYFLKSKTDKVTLEADAHNAIEWMSEEDIDSPKYHLGEGMKFYIREAFKKARE